MPPPAPTPQPPQEPKTKAVWENRFAKPKPADLLAELSKPASTLAEALRAGLTSSNRHVERLSWQGIPWRWSFVYSPNPATEPAAAKNAGLTLYLIPSPVRLEVALALPDASISLLLSKKQPKALKETLGAASLVGGQRFVRWDLASKAQCDEILALLDQLLALSLAKPDTKPDTKPDPKPDSKSDAKADQKHDTKPASKR